MNGKHYKMTSTKTSLLLQIFVSPYTRITGNTLTTDMCDKIRMPFLRTPCYVNATYPQLECALVVKYYS